MNESNVNEPNGKVDGKKKATEGGERQAPEDMLEPKQTPAPDVPGAQRQGDTPVKHEKQLNTE